MQRHLNALALSTFITWAGQRVSAVALPLVALEQTGAAWSTGLVAGFAGLPLLTSGWWGRGLRPYLRSGRGLACLLLLQALGVAIVPLAAISIGVDMLVLCLSGLVIGVGGALLPPAQRALTADIADGMAAESAADWEDDSASTGTAIAARALAWQDLAHRVSMVFAPPLAAVLLVGQGAVPLLWWQAAALVLAAAVTLTVPPSGRSEPSGRLATALTDAAASSDLRARTSLWRAVAEHPELLVGIVLAGIGGLAWFAFDLGLALLGVELGRPGDLIAAGMSGYGFASVVMSAVTPALIQRLPRIRTILLSWAILGIAFVVLPLVAPSLLGIGLVAALGGACMPLTIAALNGLIAERTSGESRHAAFTAQTIVHAGSISLGMLVGGFVIGWLGAGPTLVAVGLLQVAAPVVAVAWLRAILPAAPKGG